MTDEYDEDLFEAADEQPKDIETQPTLPFLNPNDQVVELPTLPKPEDESPLIPELPGARTELASAPMNLEQPDPTARGPWIQYNGPATVRVMDAQAWASAKVPSRKRYEWNYLNGKRLPRSMFSDEELQYLLRVDDRFSLETK